MALPTDEERAVIIQRVPGEWADADAGGRMRVDRKACDLLIRD